MASTTGQPVRGGKVTSWLSKVFELNRAGHIAVFGLIGAGLTALGFGISGSAWGWLVLAAFAVTLAAGLAVAFGVHRFVAAYLLNIWFIVAFAVGSGFHQDAHITSYTWAQTLAWAGGSALWIAVTFGGWLIRGREDRPQPVAELPGDTARRKLLAGLLARRSAKTPPQSVTQPA